MITAPIQLPIPIAPSAGPVANLAGFQHAYADVNGTRLHYVIGGQGPAIVLLHGWPYTWALWRRLMPLLAQSGYTVVAPDLRGLGDSARPDTGYAKLNVARDIYELTEQLGLVDINLVGTDIGAMVAYAYAAAYSRQAVRLVLAESLLPDFGLEEWMNPATGGYWHFGFHMQGELATMLTAGREVAYLLPTLAMMSTTSDALEVATAEYLLYYAAPGGMRAGFRHYESLLTDGQENRARFVTSLPMPVLILNGDHGLPQAPLLAGAQQVATRITADLVPASGHTFAQDNPTWVARRLRQFFGDEQTIA